MKTLQNKWFLLGCITWAVVISARKTGHPLPFINGYINDTFAIPVIANLGLWFQRVFIYKSNYYVLAPWHIIFIVAYVGLMFEGLLPLYSKNYTADWVDAGLYVAGGLFFYFAMNKPLLKERFEL
jgi:hypothetical protein